MFKNLTFGKLPDSNEVNIPGPGVVPTDAGGGSMPFAIVGDEAFVQSEHALRQYPN
jgi:hypothetical protein